MARGNFILLVALAGIVCLIVESAQGQGFSDDGDQGYYEEENLPPPVPRRSSPPKASSHRSSSSSATSRPPPPPVAILKQINRHNEDGSYTYGYEGEDGSFKIETKLPTGEVMGKYGYVDDTGKVRVVEYGANRYGFMPSGEGITVAPPTLVDDSTDKNGNRLEEIDEEPEVERPAPRPVIKVAPRPAPKPVLRPSPIEFEETQQFEPAPPRPVFQPAPQAASKPKYSSSPIEHSFTSALPSSRSSASHSAPVPPRPNFANAAPIPVARSSPPRSSPISHSFPAPASRPSPLDSFGPAPAPVFEEPVSRSRPAPPRPAPARLPVPQRAASGGILDQLARDYALPQGDSRTAVDISFSTI